MTLTDKLLSRLEQHHSVPLPEKISVPIVVREVAEAIEVCVLPVESTAPTIEGIKRVVCRYFGLTHTHLISERRCKEQLYPRHVAMYLCRDRTPQTLPQIGKRFGGRDHTTVLHAANKIARLIRVDWKVAFDVAEIEAQL